MKTGGPCPTPLRVGPPCTLSVIGPLPMTACRFSLVLTLDLWSVMACHRLLLSGPDREGLVERAVSLRPTDAHCRPPRQLVLPPLAGRAVAGFLILSPSPQSPHSRIGDDLVTLPHVLHEAGPEHLVAPASSCCRLPISSLPGSLSNEYDVIVSLRLPCGVAVGDTTHRVVTPSLATHHASHLRSLRGCWIVKALKASGVTLPNLLPQMLVD